MANVLVIGTYAIDYIGRYPKPFESIPDHQSLNISISLSEFSRGFGGCALNIAVGLRKLGHHALPFAYVGSSTDEDYRRHLDQLGVDQRGLLSDGSSSLSSHALIMSDTRNNQFTAFYPGPSRSPAFLDDLKRVCDQFESTMDFVVLAPDIAPKLLQAAEFCLDQKLPFFCDPGQCITDYSVDDCQHMVELSDWICVNHVEYQLLESRVPDLLNKIDVLIVTRGQYGVQWRLENQWYFERAAVPNSVVDVTGSGDAFRAGVLHAYLQGANWRDTMRAGALLAAINVENHGTQTFTVGDFAPRYREAWDDHPHWLE